MLNITQNIGKFAISVSLAALCYAPLDAEENKLEATIQSTVTLGLGMRLNNPDLSNVGIGNGGTYQTLNEDDGNLNYGSGSFYSKSFKSMHEFDISYGDSWSAFVRISALYDYDIMKDDTFRTPLSGEAKDDLGHELRVLDAYWIYDTELSNNPVTFKVGNQVLSWGESTFIQNGLNSINPFDVGKLRTAGAQLKDGLLPVPMAVVNLEMTENFSVEAFWQWSHRKTRIDPRGSMFSDNDFVSPGADFAHIDPGGIGTDLWSGADSQFGASGFGEVARRGDHPSADPEDEGNMGISFKWLHEKLNNTEFGFYGMRYTSRLPLISGFQGAVSPLVTDPLNGTGAVQTILGFASALDVATPYAQLPQATRGLLDTAHAAAAAGAFGVGAQGRALAGQTAEQMRVELVQGMAAVGQLGDAAQAADAANLAAAIGARAQEVSGGAYVPNSYYFLEYPEDIMMYGMSFNTMIGEMALQGEYSYKIDQPIQIDDQVLLSAALGAPGQLGTFQTPGGAGIIQGWRPKNVSQGQVTMTRLLGKKFGSDNLTSVAEVGYTKVHGMEAHDVLRYEAQGTPSGQGYPNSFSWGYRIAFVADYFNFWESINLRPSISFAHDVNGTSPKPISNFIEDRKSLTIALSADYQNEYAAKLSYTNFLGDDVNHSMRDRDFVTFSISKFF